jgi:hypothetical protein
MQKYTNDKEIRYFEDDVIVKDWINLKEYRLMTDEEILKHETKPLSEFHNKWNGKTWVDERTDAEILEYNRSIMPALTRYQFKRCLLENGFKISEIESKIKTIENETVRELTLLGFMESDRFVRTDASILVMQDVLGLTSEKIDELWNFALTL